MENEVEILPAARDELADRPNRDRSRVRIRIDALAMQPRPVGVDSMAGQRGVYRIRVGTYRVVYRVDDGRKNVTVERIGHRKDVYRR